MNLRPLLFFPPIVLGVVGFVWMTRDSGEVAPPRPETELAVRIETVAPHDLSPVAVGYGRVQAVHDWSAISESQGRIAEMAAGLAVGRIVEADELLIAVDKTDYRLTLEKAGANLLAAQARLAELDRQEQNTSASLTIEKRVLDVATAEHARIRDLVARGTGTQAALDAQEKTLLKQQQAVDNLENTMALFPSQRKSAEATLSLRQAEVAEAKRALSKTEIRAPFRGRVSKVSVEAGQFVRVGESLLTIEGTDAAEIVAEVQPGDFRKVVVSSLDGAERVVDLVDTSQVIDRLGDLGVRAEVRLELPGIDAVWPATITRMRGTLETSTGTLGLVVQVDDPNAIGAAPGRPPLTTGAFVSVAFLGPDRTGVLSVPRDALRHDDSGAAFVYLADGDDRLAIRTVTEAEVLGERVIIHEGLAPGDRVLLSDPRPPVPGLKLIPVAAAAGQ